MAMFWNINPCKLKPVVNGFKILTFHILLELSELSMAFLPQDLEVMLPYEESRISLESEFDRPVTYESVTAGLEVSPLLPIAPDRLCLRTGPADGSEISSVLFKRLHE